MPKDDALSVQRVKQAGGVIVAKTNVPVGLADWQSYNPIYGVTNNPYDTGRTPGGSSGGSAAALAAGYGPLSLGSDIGGSLRVPAHYCGVYAHKPTLQLVASRGHTPPSLPPLPVEHDLAVVGPMARSAADLALLLDVIAGPDELDAGVAHKLDLPPARHTDLKSHRILVLDTHPLIPTDSSVRDAIAKLTENLTKSGVGIERQSDLLPDLASSARLYMRMLLSFLAATFPPEALERAKEAVAKLDATTEPRLRALARHGAQPPRVGAGERRTQRAARAMARALQQVRRGDLSDHADASLSARPFAGPGHARHHDRQHAASLLRPADLARSRNAAGPARHVDPDRLFQRTNLPVGVQIIGPWLEDRTPLKLAELIEREFGGFVPPKGFDA